MPVTVGVLALQGAFDAHRRRLCQVLGDNGSVRLVRTASALEGIDALVMPGGESTTMSNLLARDSFGDELAERLDDGLCVFGTCAGMILLATKVLDGRADQRNFADIDITVRRNGYGRQLDSFETDLDVDGLDEPFHAVFIRAPRIEAVGADVDVLASIEGEPVLVRQGSVLAAAFHPELTPDSRLHRLFVDSIPGATTTSQENS